MDFRFFSRIELTPALRNKRNDSKVRSVALLRFFVAISAFLLYLALGDHLDTKLCIALTALLLYAALIFFIPAWRSVQAKYETMILLLDEGFIFLVCFLSGGLGSPFLIAFLLPVLFYATSPSALRLSLATLLTITFMLALGLVTGFDRDVFVYHTAILILAGLSVNTLVFNDFRVLSSYAVRDGLTGLYTHQYFFDQLAILAEQAAGTVIFSIIMIDLDEFKKLNDDYGHLEGDRVLKEVAAAIKRNVRDSDIVSRYGGDEFAIILPGVGWELCSAIKNRLRISIIELGCFQDVSIGSALYPEDATDIFELVHLADKRMYKQKGKNLQAGLLFDSPPID